MPLSNDLYQARKMGDTITREIEEAAEALEARVAELEAILWGHVIVAGETKAITASLEKCMEMECALPSATVKMAKEALSLRKKALKELSLA